MKKSQVFIGTILIVLIFAPIVLAATKNTVHIITLERIAVFFGIFSYLCTVYAWWKAAEGKKFAAEQNYSQLIKNQDEILKEISGILHTVERHERRTFEKFTASTNEIHRKLDIAITLTQQVLIQATASNVSIGSKKND